MDHSNTEVQSPAPTALLPFRVEIASKEQMDEVAQLRSATYGRHLPELAKKLQEPEPADFDLTCEVFVVRSKLDGSLLGSMRTHANVHHPLPLQASIGLPANFNHARMVETTRLCVAGSPNSPLVRSSLFKALYQYTLMQKVDWMMATGRRPVDRIYDSLLFSDVQETGRFYPMTHVGGLPHRVMCLSPIDAKEMWGAVRHPLYEFVVDTHHPDIDLSAAANLNFEWLCPVEAQDSEPLEQSPLLYRHPSQTIASLMAMN